MNRLLFGLGAVVCLCACSSQPEPAVGSHADRIVAELHNPTSKYVLVVSHRGDWRNWPENSIPAIESVIDMGVDIMELDLKLTRDSVLVLCHDHTIDRTTSGKGLVADITYDSIRRCVLRAGQGVKTSWRMPTLREALAVCKDRIVVNIDQGYEYYDLALAVAEELGVTDQLLIKGKRPAEVVAAKFAEYPHNMMYMPIIDILRPEGRALFESYRQQAVQPLAYEICWDRFTPAVDSCMRRVVSGGSRLWVNSLWPSLNGGLDDDRAFAGEEEEVYGRLLEMGASIIQTDRPQLLIDYLRSKGRRP